MRTMTAREANQAFSKLLAEVDSGEEVVITRRGRPIAIVKPYGDAEAEARRKAGEELVAFLEKGLDLGGLRINREELYAERDDELEARRRKSSGR